MTPSTWWKRISAAAAALAIGAVSAVALAPPAAAADRSTTVTVTKASAADGLVLTVEGTGYTELPNPVEGIPGPAAGVYVGLYDTQIDNDDATSGNATNSTFVPNATISGGSFTANLTTDVTKLDNDSDYKILVWVAHGLPRGAALLDTKTLTLTTAQKDALFPTPTPTRSTSVTVTKASAADGLVLTVEGTGYTELPNPVEGIPGPAAGVYVGLYDTQIDNDDATSGNATNSTFVPNATISGGSFTTTLTTAVAKLNSTSNYKLLVWSAHGLPRGAALLDTKTLTLTTAQRAALFGTDDGTPEDEQPAVVIEGENSVEHGATITFTGTGFEPGELVNGTVHSDPISLGSKNADEKGTVTFTWNVPAGFEVGDHHLELVGQTSFRTATVPFTIAAPAEETPEGSTTNKPSKTTKPAAADDPVCTEENIPARAGTSSLSWGVKSSFTSYVEGGIANGTITVSSGAARSGGGFTWGTGAGSLKANGTGTLTFPGSVRFTGHDGVLDTTISNLRVAITSSTSGTLTATVRSQDMSGKTTASGPVTLANLTFSSLSATKGTATVTLTEAGAAAFAGFYEAGEALDPLTVTVAGATAASTRTVCHNADGDLVDADGNVIEETVNGLASTGVRGVGTMAGLAALLILGGGALLMRERRTRAVHR